MELEKISHNTSQNKFEKKILNYLKINPSGSTITDIANGLKASRNTISKYIKTLEKKEEIHKRKIGKYIICFHSDKDILPKNQIYNIYKGLLYGLKREFPNQEKKFKEVGKHIAEYYIVPMGPLLDAIKDLDTANNVSLKDVLEIFENMPPYQEAFQDPIKLTSISKEGNKLHLRYSNSNFLEGTDDFIYHAYMMCGYIEKMYEKTLGKSFKCNIEKIHTSKNKEESYFDVVFEIQS